jgi:hypothetical protein
VQAMANYTIELNRLVKSGFKIFDFEYDFYDPSKKADFENLFIDRFYNDEICCETPLRWQRYLKVIMKTKFPYYNMLLVTAQINYEKTKNYNITETQSRDVNNTSNSTGSNLQNTSGQSTDNSQNNTSFTNHSVDEGNKSNDLSSTTAHSEESHDTTTESGTDKITEKTTEEKNLDATKVHSTTPKSMLSLSNLKSNIYASDAERNDNSEDNTTDHDSTATKSNTTTDNSNSSSSDSVHATNTESDNNTNDSNGSTNGTGNVTHNETGSSTNNLTQNTTGNTKESYTRTMSGSYGVITEADMLQKHIGLQDKLTHIFNDFFENECHDLFMELYS